MSSNANDEGFGYFPNMKLPTGMKNDTGRPAPDLFEIGFANAIRLVQGTMEYGAVKYAEDNWRLVPNALSRYTRAAARHRQERQLDVLEKGHDSILHSRDSETKLPHIAHEIFNLMCMLEMALVEEAKNSDDMSEREIMENLLALMKLPTKARSLAELAQSVSYPTNSVSSVIAKINSEQKEPK